MKVAIIGAGPSGLALAKQLKDRDILFDVFEQDSQLGGVWNSANAHSVMYDSVHTISSKSMTEFSDFPMPKEYSEYISHQKMLRYLRLYTEKYNLLKHIFFDTKVTRIHKTPQDEYELSTEAGHRETYQFVAVASGHVNKPNFPPIDTKNFDGQIMHSSEYKEPALFRNKNVLIVGAGNSGCDIACEAISTAKHVSLSIRRGYYYIPKFILGMPADVFGETSVKLRLPIYIRQLINQIILRIHQGNLQKIGFPKPDHRIFESHPIVNELLIYYVRQGDIDIHKDIIEIRSTDVKFCDGRNIKADIILFATGYTPDYPFLTKDLVPHPQDLHLNLFSKKHSGLSFLGLLDPNGGILGTLESQAIAVALSISLQSRSKKGFSPPQEDIALNGGIQYITTARHCYEVERSSYRREIQKKITELKKYLEQGQ